MPTPISMFISRLSLPKVKSFLCFRMMLSSLVFVCYKVCGVEWSRPRDRFRTNHLVFQIAFPHFASDFTKFHSILNIPLLRLLADGVYTLPEDKEVRSSRSLSFMDDDKPSFGGVEKSSEYSDEFKCHAMLLIELIAKNDGL